LGADDEFSLEANVIDIHSLERDARVLGDEVGVTIAEQKEGEPQ